MKGALANFHRAKWVPKIKIRARLGVCVFFSQHERGKVERFFLVNHTHTLSYKHCWDPLRKAYQNDPYNVRNILNTWS